MPHSCSSASPASLLAWSPGAGFTGMDRPRHSADGISCNIRLRRLGGDGPDSRATGAREGSSRSRMTYLALILPPVSVLEASGATPGLTPSEITTRIPIDGARKTLAAIYENSAPASSSWNDRSLALRGSTMNPRTVPLRQRSTLRSDPRNASRARISTRRLRRRKRRLTGPFLVAAEVSPLKQFLLMYT